MYNTHIPILFLKEKYQESIVIPAALGQFIKLVILFFVIISMHPRMLIKITMVMKIKK